MTNKRVLIVDDEEWICSVLQDYLEESGYDVQTAGSLTLARQCIKGHDLPDVMVVDMSLPDGNGMTFLDDIRADVRTQEIPFILITAHSSHKLDKSPGAQQPNDCILKPFNLGEFKTRLDRQIASK